MKKTLVAVQVPAGSAPAHFNTGDATAMQALANGAANEGQQKRALDWILTSACGLPVWGYRESQRETDIALGRQFVGQQIVGLINVKVSELRKREGQEETEHG